MANLVAIAGLLCGITILFGILSLSLDHWQGRNLSFSELLKAVDKDGILKKYIPGTVPKFAESYISTTGTYGYDFSALGGVVSENTDPIGDILLQSRVNIYGGIWHICFNDFEIPMMPLYIPEICVFLENKRGFYVPPSSDAWIRADWYVPRAMLFLAIFSTAASVLCMIGRSFILLQNTLLLTVATVLSFLSGIFYMTGFSYFVDTMKLEFLDYQTAFYFCILCWLMSWASGGLLLAGRKSHKDSAIL